MFLFTTPTGAPSSPPTGAPANPVTDAIRRGAERTGASFDYLVATAKRESAMDPAAKAPTSSASGLFQFIEQTWLGVVKSDGDKAGLGDYADAITARSDGTLTVGDAATKQAILKLREDPGVASIMAGALTRQNRDALAAATGREPTDGDLYIAHVLGARGAGDLIRAAQQNPAKTAALDFPEAAAANRGIFYDRAGRPRGAAEVYAVLAGEGAARPAAAPIASAATAPDAPAPLEPYGSGSGSLFQTGRRAGPISDAVARIWRVNNGSARVAATGSSFFPKSEAAAAAGEPTDLELASVEPAAGSSAPISTISPPASPRSGAFDPLAPLPPPRPRFERGAAVSRRPAS